MNEDKKELFHRLFDGCNKKNFREFCEWIKANPEIYSEFVRLAFEYKRAGNKKCSGWLLANVIRWNQEIKYAGSEFKIKNINIAFLSRLAILKNPELENFFNLASWRA